MIFNMVERSLVGNPTRIPHLGREMPLRGVYGQNRGCGRGFTKHRTEPLSNVNGLWSEVWFGYHPDGTMEITLHTRKNIDFGMSTYVDRDWGIWDTNRLDDLYKNIRKGKMPRGFVHTEGAKFIPESTGRR